MKIPISFCLAICSLLFPCCSKDDSPVSPPLPKTMSVSAYGNSIDSSYYKVWSDSSWEKFDRVASINNIRYAVVSTHDGGEYYYSALGYAGFKAPGQPIILFDRALPSLPDTIVFGETYARETTFFFEGYNYTLRAEQSLRDTVAVSVPFGIFQACLWFTSKSILSAGGESESQSAQFWLAIGPSDIKQVLNSGLTIVMVRGKVNGQGWGMPFFKQLPSRTGGRSSGFLADLMKPLRG